MIFSQIASTVSASWSEKNRHVAVFGSRWHEVTAAAAAETPMPNMVRLAKRKGFIFSRCRRPQDARNELRILFYFVFSIWPHPDNHSVCRLDAPKRSPERLLDPSVADSSRGEHLEGEAW